MHQGMRRISRPKQAYVARTVGQTWGKRIQLIRVRMALKSMVLIPKIVRHTEEDFRDFSTFCPAPFVGKVSSISLSFLEFN